MSLRAPIPVERPSDMFVRAAIERRVSLNDLVAQFAPQYAEGERAYLRQEGTQTCPYDVGTLAQAAWRCGWQAEHERQS